MWVLALMKSWHAEQTDAVGVMLWSSFGLARLLPVFTVVGRALVFRGTVKAVPTWQPEQFLRLLIPAGV
jgi:hypothetical protein